MQSIIQSIGERLTLSGFIIVEKLRVGSRHTVVVRRLHSSSNIQKVPNSGDLQHFYPFCVLLNGRAALVGYDFRDPT